MGECEYSSLRASPLAFEGAFREYLRVPAHHARLDVVIVGAGPAGSVAAAMCAAAGLRVALLERARFPREKVCGDCLNPGCWPIFRRLDLVERVRALPHAALQTVEFHDLGGRCIAVPLPTGDEGEIAVKRSHLDALLLSRARELGARVFEETTVSAAAQTEEGWTVTTQDGAAFAAPILMAADGRNSTIARLCNLLPSAKKGRIGQQTHLSLPPALRGRVAMHFHEHGYAGIADVGEGQANLCLVSRAEKMPALKEWALDRFAISDGQPWRSITPLERDAAMPYQNGIFLLGDAARVVEPFTGEGILYAMRSGALAAEAAIAGDPSMYQEGHARLYRGRLWLNRFAKAACLHPRLAQATLRAARAFPSLLRWLTRQSTRAPAE